MSRYICTGRYLDKKTFRCQMALRTWLSSKSLYFFPPLENIVLYFWVWVRAQFMLTVWKEILCSQNLGQCCLKVCPSSGRKKPHANGHAFVNSCWNWSAFGGQDEMLLCNIWLPCKHEQSFWNIRYVFLPSLQELVRRLHHLLLDFVNKWCGGSYGSHGAKPRRGSRLVALHTLPWSVSHWRHKQPIL